MITQKNLHVGIYGVITKDDSILVIRKSRGPYKGLFDLPGGRPLHGEPLEQALKREVAEETGIHVLAFSFWEIFHSLPHTKIWTEKRKSYTISRSFTK